MRERRSYEETWFRRRRFFFDLALTSSLDLAFTKKKKTKRKQYLGNLGCDYVVVANDACSVADIAAMNPAGVLVSPGPGAPEESGISLEAGATAGAAAAEQQSVAS